MSTAIAFIGLGSNLNDPRYQLDQAVAHLSDLPLSSLNAISPYYQSKPVGPQDQPDFINACAMLETRLSPLALLDQLQAIEQRHQRQRARHWGPRTLDLDLLLYDDQVWQHPRLTLPHPEMRNRAFVLIPLSDIAFTVCLPDGSAITSHITPHMRTSLLSLSPSE